MLTVKAIDHVGIRVSDRERSLAFYQKLGFELVWSGGPEPVAIIRNSAGIEINLIVNGVPDPANKNVLLDQPTKYPGYTHVAYEVHSSSVEHVIEELRALGVAITEGPIELGGAMAIFVRDPDGNVIELRAAP
jgi:catechol 2,3-dioxygenase-like lactoylglutathione lyase family enzyme